MPGTIGVPSRRRAILRRPRPEPTKNNGAMKYSGQPDRSQFQATIEKRAVGSTVRNGCRLRSNRVGSTTTFSTPALNSAPSTRVESQPSPPRQSVAQLGPPPYCRAFWKHHSAVSVKQCTELVLATIQLEAFKILGTGRGSSSTEHPNFLGARSEISIRHLSPDVLAS